VTPGHSARWQSGNDIHFHSFSLLMIEYSPFPAAYKKEKCVSYSQQRPFIFSCIPALFAQILPLSIVYKWQLLCFFLLFCRNLFFKPLAFFEIFCILSIIEKFYEASKIGRRTPDIR